MPISAKKQNKLRAQLSMPGLLATVRDRLDFVNNRYPTKRAGSIPTMG